MRQFAEKVVITVFNYGCLLDAGVYWDRFKYYLTLVSYFGEVSYSVIYYMHGCMLSVLYLCKFQHYTIEVCQHYILCVYAVLCIS